MTSLTFVRPTIEPLHPSSWQRPTSGPDADDFRVTQQFDDLDAYWSKADPAKAVLKHRATDIGNARCGYPLVAMHRSRITRHQDNATAYGAPTNALCARQDVGPGSGLVIDYWHISGWAVPDGAIVEPGTVIAYVGKTGLGQVCHTHVTFRLNGVLIDPEPHLFGAPLVLEEELMSLPVTGLMHAVLGAGNNIRRSPGGAVARTTEKAIFVDVLAIAEQRASWTLPGGKSGDEWYEIEAYAERGYVATGLLTLELTESGKGVIALPAADCAGEVQNARDQAAAAVNKAWRAWLTTAPGS